MIIGVPKEIKNNEFRVAITAAGVHEFRTHGHTVLVERGAGLGSGITDEEYSIAGAEIVVDADDVWARADMVMKVKEPIKAEYHRFRKDLILFTYLHLAAEPELTRELINSGVTAIAYETVQEGRTLPLLAPMSEVAGRLSVQVGASSLMAPAGGKGVLLGGVPGVRPAKVVVLGAGVAGTNAAAMALGLGADVNPRHQHQPPPRARCPVPGPAQDRGFQLLRDREVGHRRRPGDRLSPDPRCEGTQAGHQ